MKLYVGNLPYNISDDQLSDLFAKFGTPDSAKVIQQQPINNFLDALAVRGAGDEVGSFS